MSQEPIIRVDGVSKTFRSYRHPADRLKEVFLRRQAHSVHRALQDVSLTLEPGQAMGLLGRNGAGKSTLLKMIMGVIVPDSGSVTLNGKVTGLLELGTGFNAQLSGRDNIAFNAMLLGLTPDQIEERRESIIGFTEMQAFIDNPLGTYSSGMIMRLAFSIAIHADPRCFIVDEALAVGDAYFQQKCMRQIHRFREGGGAILLVSHDFNSVKMLCDKAALLEGGAVVREGLPKDVIDYYEGTVLSRLHQGGMAVDVAEATPDIDRGTVTGTGEIEIDEVRVEADDGRTLPTVTSETPIVLTVKLRGHRDVAAPHYGFAIRDRHGRSVFETNTYCMGMTPPPLVAGAEPIEVRFRFICNLAHGDYAVSVGVASDGFDKASFREYLHLQHEAAILRVLSNDEKIVYAGLTNLNPLCTVGHPVLA